MKKIRYILLLGFFAASTSSALAQPIRSIYFAEQNPLRHQLNASFAPQSGYVAMPFFGNLNLSTTGNLKLSSFLYPAADGSLNSFLSNEVTTQMFNNALKSDQHLGASMSMDIVSGGWYSWGGFNTASLTLKANSSGSLPQELFSMLKEGMQEVNTQNIYNINQLKTQASSYVELALGHSRELKPGLRVGAKMKFIFGLAHLDMDVQSMDVMMSADKWTIDNRASLQSAGFNFRTLGDGTLTSDDMDFSPGVNGFGLAFDVGASWEIIKDLTVSLGVNDLGFISWKTNEYRTNAEPFVFDGFTDVDILGSGEGESLSDQFDNLGDELKAMFDFYQYKMGARTSVATPTSIKLSGEYGWVDNMISVGMLGTAQFHGAYTWLDVLLSANYRPCHWFTLGVNASYSNMGHSFGGLLDFTTRGFNVYLGVNATSFKYTSGDLPLPLNGFQSQFNLGMNFMLFKNRPYNKTYTMQR